MQRPSHANDESRLLAPTGRRQHLQLLGEKEEASSSNNSLCAQKLRIRYVLIAIPHRQCNVPEYQLTAQQCTIGWLEHNQVNTLFNQSRRGATTLLTPYTVALANYKLSPMAKRMHLNATATNFRALKLHLWHMKWINAAVFQLLTRFSLLCFSFQIWFPFFSLSLFRTKKTTQSCLLLLLFVYVSCVRAVNVRACVYALWLVFYSRTKWL